MKRLIVAIILGALAWSGYWLIAITTTRNAIENWFTAAQSQPLRAEYDALNLRGFPSRVDARFHKLSFENDALSWSAPKFELLGLSYKPRHKILVWPKNQALRIGAQDWALSSSDMRASLIFGASGGLERFNWTGTDLRLVSHDEEIAIPAAKAALHLMDQEALKYRLALELSGILARHEPPLPYPERVRLDAVVSLAAPIVFASPQALASILGTITHLEIIAVEIGNETLALQGRGKLQKTPKDDLEGAVTLQIQNWPGLAAYFENDPLMQDSIAPVLETVFAMLAKGSRDLELALRFEKGKTYLGSFPIGPAPEWSELFGGTVE